MGCFMSKPRILRNDFGALNLEGRRYVVTGGSSGSGCATVAFLAEHGAQVITSGRSVERGKSLLDARLSASARARVELYFLDLNRMTSVESFAEKVAEKFESIDGLVNNAGGSYLASDPGRVVRHGDSTFDANMVGNHIGPFHLTNLLLPLLKKNKRSRVVNVSSFMHDNYDGAGAKAKRSHIDFDDLHFRTRPYDFGAAYGQSKLANVLHAKELARRHGDDGVHAYALHPGFMDSRFARSFPAWVVMILKPVMACFKCCNSDMAPISWEDGAETSLHCLLSEDALAHSGAYYSQLAMIGYSAGEKLGWPLRSANPEAHDEAVAGRLWTVSASLVEDLRSLEHDKTK